MKFDFTYYNPTKIYFGKDSLNNLEGELKKYGKTVLLVYGKNSIKKNGLYDKVIEILKSADKKVIELAGIKKLSDFIKEMEIPTTLKEIGATEEMLPLIANSTVIMEGGYKKLTADEILEILKESF